MQDFLPVEGCWVVTGDSADYAVVLGSAGERGVKVRMAATDLETVLREGEWRCGIEPGFTVQDVPVSAARRPLGVGTAVQIREIAGREQVAVHFHALGEIRWIPFERLVRIMDPTLQYVRAQQAGSEAGERTAVAVMAHALRTWNEATGALDRLDVDPLPHQIGLVHRIVNSGTINWLIADDVGLGKTIEVGLLLGALERRQNMRRVLVIVPSGLTRQWKDEMSMKFDRHFMIYGRDFQIEHAREWALYDRVVVSLDLVKPRDADDAGQNFATRFGKLISAPKWDLVIFDEGHRLSRGDSSTTLRYRLAKELRERTDSMLLLTGTPHQGDSEKFANLLRLVRPDLDQAIRRIATSPEIVGDIVLRNRKIDAVDAEGNFIFHGLLVKRVEIELQDDVAELSKRLSAYLRHGYRAGDEIGGKVGRAIGFVMTIYRKLASSSVYALALAMMRRRARLVGDKVQPGYQLDLESLADESVVELAESEDDLANAETGDANPFFSDEMAYINSVLEQVRKCLVADEKSRKLLELVDDLVVRGNGRLLVFTEYRATQTFLAKLVEKQLGKPPLLIHGGLNVDQKRQAVDDFDAEPTVLISTEAGGEGLNLQRNCHVMVNYDLPWNPSRLTQRIGRLYRYGQSKRVIVLNFHARDTIDNEILSTVLERLEVIIEQMASVNPDEFNETYRAEVLGELLERLDITALLEEARGATIERSTERVDAALANARDARNIQEEILSYATSLEGEGWANLGAYSSRDMAVFVGRACTLLDIGFAARAGDTERLELRLPDEMRGRFPEFGGRTVIDATTRRGGGHLPQDKILLDFASTFVRYLVAAVTAPEFGGGFGQVADPDSAGRTLAAFLTRFQNDQGQPRGEDLVVAIRHADGQIELDNTPLRDLFRNRQASVERRDNDHVTRHDRIAAMRERVEAEMAAGASRFRHPHSIVPAGLIESCGEVYPVTEAFG